MKKMMLASAVLMVALTSGCASWDSMNSRQKSAAVGAGVGGVGRHGADSLTLAA